MSDNIATQWVSVVTGAARGIGLAMAQWFLQHGWCVALLDRDCATLQLAVSGLNEPQRTLAVLADVSELVKYSGASERVPETASS